MRNSIYIMTFIAALSWSALAFAQDASLELSNAAVSEPVSAEAAPAPAAASYLIPEDPAETAPAVAEESVPSEETPAVEAQIQEEPPVAEAQMAPAADGQIQEETPAAEAQMDPAVDGQMQPESSEPDNALQAAEDVPQEIAPEQSDAAENAEPQTGWRSGLAPYIGIGPAFDMLDDATGYSARIGFDMHWKYIGIGLEVTWNMIWAKDGTKRSDHNDIAYRTTNSGLLALLNGYIPLTDHFIIKLGAGIGLGKRYEITFSDLQADYFNSEDSSWLARLQAGMFWLFDSNFTLGLDMEFNFGGYTDPGAVWWSDKEDDISLGLVLTLSYQYMD
ncbi:MAG: hypothetical protein J6A01_08855 [Proteobacteria bacterium]|nr:hypothetical protein [Pseudomonadota bacterium]